jgi:1-acyl-sn-glycerol-3-phosphate acyltransferase
MRFLLAPLRAVMVLVLIALGLVQVFGIYPWVRQGTRNRITHLWSRALVATCGARLVVHGTIPAPIRRTGVDDSSVGRLGLSNHVSWIDIFAINAATPCRFIAKSEIGRWPVIGALVTGSGTLYIERGRRHAVAAMNHRVRNHLSAGETITVFAEGTTTDGSQLLPFHSNMVAPAIDVKAPVWPIAVCYTEGGRRSTAAAFIDDMDLLTSLWRIFTARDLTIEIAVLPPISTSAGASRHAVARAARDSIARHLGLGRAHDDDAIGI